jgi:hypothetical protein
MSNPDTILTDLLHRIERYRTRYGSLPDKLPVTLDEMAWLSEAAGAGPCMPRSFGSIRLELVQRVSLQADGSMKVQP